MQNKFKKGLILGGLLAVGAAVGFVMMKEGQQLTEELQKDLKSLAKLLKMNLHKLEDVTETNFDDLVTKVIDEYAEKKELADEAKKKLTTALQAMWHEMETEYLAEKDEVMTKI